MLNDYFFDFSKTEFLFYTPLKESSSFLPITVISAIFLFILKEVVEAIKKRGANRRKISAMKRFFSRECERNLWTIQILNSVLSDINEGYKNNKDIDIKFGEHDPSYVYILYDGTTRMGSKITEVQRDIMDKNLMEAAVISKPLFERLEVACDALAELDHVRSSFLNINKTSEETGHPLLAGFVGYGIEELSDIKQSLNDLYKYCTGHELEKARLR
ncbi:hypothetical protein [Serratia sarumanii]|uniref:hypothetical protein n=1 Tax=Serratia sarumanii TaxID=3020826 RepID=UPI003F80EE58